MPGKRLWLDMRVVGPETMNQLVRVSRRNVSGISEGQVLQRNALGHGAFVLECQSDLTSTQGQPAAVEVAHAGTQVLTVAGMVDAFGRLSVQLSGVPVGGPYRIDVVVGASRLQVIRKFWVGDVWVLAGQSNMEGVGNISPDASSSSQIRVWTMGRRWRRARDPLHVPRESPEKVHHGERRFSKTEADRYRLDAIKGVGPGLSFARALVDSQGVPQGLIPCAQGGSSMAQWSPLTTGDNSLFGALVRQVRATGQRVAGVLWYQGESETAPQDSGLYSEKMADFIGAVRRELGQPELPFHMCQLGRVALSDGKAGWESIREQQRNLPVKVPGVTLTGTVDLSLDDHIHLSGSAQRRLGPRLARAVRSPGRLPHLKSIECRVRSDLTPTSEMVLSVRFEGVELPMEGLLHSEGFELRGVDGQKMDIIYRSLVDGEVVHLFLAHPPPPGTCLHYGAGTNPYAQLRDARDLAIPAFGPIEVSKPLLMSPFVKEVLVSEFKQPSSPFLEEEPTVGLDHLRLRSFDDGFINFHKEWRSVAARAVVRFSIHVPREMTIHFSLGYDGPIRVWVESDEVFVDENGTNPAFPDQAWFIRLLPEGVHRMTVLFDNNSGQAYGFLMRCGVDPAQSEAVPSFST